jgi:hypothetical protein
MGTWGPASFDNDDALDLAYDLRRDTTGLELSRALWRLIATSPYDELRVDHVERAIAAAEVVAATYGEVGCQLPRDVQAWLDEHPGPLGVALLDLARDAIARVQAEMLSLKEGWFDPENGTLWMNLVDDLRHRLDEAKAVAS